MIDWTTTDEVDVEVAWRFNLPHPKKYHMGTDQMTSNAFT